MGAICLYLAREQNLKKTKQRPFSSPRYLHVCVRPWWQMAVYPGEHSLAGLHQVKVGHYKTCLMLIKILCSCLLILSPILLCCKRQFLQKCSWNSQHACHVFAAAHVINLSLWVGPVWKRRPRWPVSFVEVTWLLRFKVNHMTRPTFHPSQDTFRPVIYVEEVAGWSTASGTHWRKFIQAILKPLFEFSGRVSCLLILFTERD